MASVVTVLEGTLLQVVCLVSKELFYHKMQIFLIQNINKEMYSHVTHSHIHTLNNLHFLIVVMSQHCYVCVCIMTQLVQ